MWSGIDGMPSLISLKWTSDRSLIGSLILNEVNRPWSHECRGCTRGWRNGNEDQMRLTMRMSRIVLKHQWRMLMVISQCRMIGSISHMKYSGRSPSVDQWQNAGGLSGMLKTFMNWQWVRTLEMIKRLGLPLGFFDDVPPLGCYELVGFDCRPSY